jgi:hypothetical protein
MLNLIDEHSRECLMIRSERRWRSAEVIEALAEVMVMKGVPEHLRSDNGPEFVARDLRKWLAGTEPGRLISSREAPGRTATARASTRMFVVATTGSAGQCCRTTQDPAAQLGRCGSAPRCAVCQTVVRSGRTSVDSTLRQARAARTRIGPLSLAAKAPGNWA